MVAIPEDHSHPICPECGKEFAAVEQLGTHVDQAHRQEFGKQKDENPTNVGPGITEEFKNA
jgi:hypothetical protein